MSDTAAVPLSNTRNGYTIVTQVISPPTSTEPGQMIYTVGPLQKFLKGKPKLLGSIQIMIGLLKLLLGFVMFFNSLAFTVSNGIPFWCALMYVMSGSLAVSASKNLHRCVVTSALVMNVISTITAAITITLFSLVLVLAGGFTRCYYGCSMVRFFYLL
ncbi:membrane-spanning 4-domains subfamily A member 12-like [Colossoma macropomum]|uniref:membrane-spanning 4-domains subfamily A member 12-like n=1 Tax=Colossoma macropomum TaxID=42526 RepID=UPI0018645447|nr:membrane-spanning 4-domains subfamily A member 12-like [Colossoma macropomum]